MDEFGSTAVADRTKVSCNIPSSRTIRNTGKDGIISGRKRVRRNGASIIEQSKVVRLLAESAELPCNEYRVAAGNDLFYRAVNGHDTGQGKPCRPA